MNEKISRILDMLEKGTITADEAERLIRASNVEEVKAFKDNMPPQEPAFAAAEEERKRQDKRGLEDAWDPFSPFCDPFPGINDVTQIFRRFKDQIARYHMRRYWWNYFRLNRWYEQRRADRRRTLSVYERVRFVLLGAPAMTGFVVQAQTDITELLNHDRIAWDLFRFGLEEEFGIELTMEQTKGFKTVQDVVDFIESKQPAATPVETESKSEQNEPAAAESEPESGEPPVVEPESEVTDSLTMPDLESPE